MGLDLYDVDSNTPNTSATFSQLANEPYGLTDFEAFAAAQGKPMSFPEWGLATTPSGDDPGYIDGMGSTVANGDFAFETYFDGGSGTRLPLGSSHAAVARRVSRVVRHSLSSAATISGTVTAAGGGDLAGICAEAFLNGTDIAASATTRGRWHVYDFRTCTGQLRRHVRSGVRRRELRHAVVQRHGLGNAVGAGHLGRPSLAAAPASGINATMSPGTSISGTVSAAVGGANLAGICVSAFPAGATSNAGVADTSAADGTYTVEGLVTGQLRRRVLRRAVRRKLRDAVVQRHDDGGVVWRQERGRCRDRACPRQLASTPRWPMSTSISGTVSAAVSGADIGNMCVLGVPRRRRRAGQNVMTALDGMYTISGIAAGNYTVEFDTVSVRRRKLRHRSGTTTWRRVQPPTRLTLSAVSTSVSSPTDRIDAEMALAAENHGDCDRRRRLDQTSRVSACR